MSKVMKKYADEYGKVSAMNPGKPGQLVAIRAFLNAITLVEWEEAEKDSGKL